jgi:hypothetical protein
MFTALGCEALHTLRLCAGLDCGGWRSSQSKQQSESIMNQVLDKKITDEATSVTEANGTYTWYLNAYQLHGNLWISWSTTAPFRAQQGQIMVYNGQSFPPNPQDNVKKWTWDSDGGSVWDTGLPWGSDWYCAYNAQKSPNGPYAYIVKLITK